MITAEVDAVDPRRKFGPREFRDRVVPGMTRAKLYQVFADHGYRLGAEVGVADGRNALTMCEAIPGLRLLCVDPWEPYPGNPRGGPQAQQHGNFDLAHARLDPFGAEFRRGFSMDVVRDVTMDSLDYCYLDGHHGFDWIMQDLIEWSKRVRPGGVVGGHDFYHFRRAGVVEAVVAYTQAHGITDWHLCDEREPSFWWVKR